MSDSASSLAAADPLMGAPNPGDDQATRLRAIVDAAAPGFEPAVGRAAASAAVAARERRVPPPLPDRKGGGKPARLITISSGKGGVGKSVTAVNLAVALANEGSRITLIDLDLGTANADVLCGMMPAGRIEHVFQPLAAFDGGRRTLAEVAADAPGGFRLIAGAAGVVRMANLTADQRAEILAALPDLWPTSDAVLIDTGAGIGEGVTAFMRDADLALVITTTEPTAIADAYALIKCVAADRPRGVPSNMALVVNQVHDEAEGRAVHQRIAAVCKRFLAIDLPLAGWIAHDLRIVDSVRAKRPLLLNSPRAPASRDIMGLARHLTRELGVARGNISDAHPRRGALGRLFAMVRPHRPQ